MPSSTSEMSVAQTGTPRTKLWVPSIGSTTHCRGLEPVGANSSPMTASRGRVRLSWARIELLGVAVGVADQGEVGLGVDLQVLGTEAGDRDPLDGIREHVGEAQVVVVAGHGAQPSGRPPKNLRPGDDPVALRSQSSLGRI